mgnify:CR=1 FL=1
MLEDGVLLMDAETAADGAAVIDLFLLAQAVLACFPRPAYDGVLLPHYGAIIVWSLS